MKQFFLFDGITLEESTCTLIDLAHKFDFTAEEFDKVAALEVGETIELDGDSKVNRLE